MKLSIQAGLFAGAGEITLDRSFRQAVRTVLDATSWVELAPGWLSGSQELFDQLASGVPVPKAPGSGGARISVNFMSSAQARRH